MPFLFLRSSENNEEVIAIAADYLLRVFRMLVRLVVRANVF